MQSLTMKTQGLRKRKDGFNGLGAPESLADSSSESRESGSARSSTATGASMEDLKARRSSSRSSFSGGGNNHGSGIRKMGSKISEADMMKERFAKLLLGEDMSGTGKGVGTALSISNAITNLSATIFGQLWRLEPVSPEKKLKWQREMNWFLSVSDFIVELIPSWQTFPDGTKHEIMTCRPRLDIFMNLPALRKLDNMLLDILDRFTETEFWYVDQGVVAPAGDGDGSASFRKAMRRQEDKWWLPVPRVPAGGLSESSRKKLNHTRECANQILKAAMAINDSALAEMEVPESYLEALPKNGRACLGDVIYRYIVSEQFSSECLLDCLDLSSEHVALEIANHVEASIHVWRRRAHPKPTTSANQSTVKSKSSWEMVKDLMVDGDKRELLAGRSESLLMSLKQRFPNLAQTTLDSTKIQFNKDVGRSILESYSRVLESLSYSIVARIDDLLYVDDLTKQSDNKSSPVSKVSANARTKAPIPYSVTALTSPYRNKTFSSPSFSPAPTVAALVSPLRGEMSPYSNKASRRGYGVKRALTSYLGAEVAHGKV